MLTVKQKRAKMKVLQRKWYLKNRDKVRALSKRWSDANARRKLEVSRKSKYPPVPRPEPKKCECCSKRQILKRAMCLDHDHDTGEFRGWLCIPCNTGIAMLGDNVKGVNLAKTYLERAK
jgi:hypothetical protein